MSESEFNPQYVIHSDEEPLRLERQARMYGTADDLRFLVPHDPGLRVPITSENEYA